MNIPPWSKYRSRNKNMLFLILLYIFHNRNAISEENEAANFSERSFSKVLFDSNDNYNGNVGKISMEDAKEGTTNMATVTKEVIIQMIRYFFAHYNQNDRPAFATSFKYSKKPTLHITLSNIKGKVAFVK